MPAGLVRRHWLAVCLLAAVMRPAAGETASAAPRLRFRSRRAVCDCGSDVDEETIERALAERRAGAASAPATAAAALVPAAADREATEERKSQSGSTTTRRPAP
ncbi:MAG: hypothetical protein KGL78_06765 [Burkholderiales bacterium]|nr:hypothetical protein [Burkholderiales bacterium]